MRPLIRMAATALAAAALAAGAQPSYQLSIVEPADQSTVFSDTGEMTVQLAVAPNPAPGESIELLVDGAPAGASASTEFALSGMTRGEHTLQARIIDSTGNVAATSATTLFYVWAASVLFPNRQGAAVGGVSHTLAHRTRSGG
jgi:hypothetical protein